MKQFRFLLTLSVLAVLSACANERIEPQRSPCVGLDNSPCGPKRAVNGKLNEMVENTVSSVIARQA